MARNPSRTLCLVNVDDAVCRLVSLGSSAAGQSGTERGDRTRRGRHSRLHTRRRRRRKMGAGWCLPLVAAPVPRCARCRVARTRVAFDRRARRFWGDSRCPDEADRSRCHLLESPLRAGVDYARRQAQECVGRCGGGSQEFQRGAAKRAAHHRQQAGSAVSGFYALLASLSDASGGGTRQGAGGKDSGASGLAAIACPSMLSNSGPGFLGTRNFSTRGLRGKPARRSG